MNNFWTGEKLMIWAQGQRKYVGSCNTELPYNTVLFEKKLVLHKNSVMAKKLYTKKSYIQHVNSHVLQFSETDTR